MFDSRKKLVLALLGAWIVLSAVGVLLSTSHVISPRLEAMVSKSLASDAALASLTPRFQGLTGSFTGTVASVEQLERAYALAEEVLPMGSFQRQPAGLFLPPPATLPAAEEAAPATKPALVPAATEPVVVPQPPAPAVPVSSPTQTVADVSEPAPPPQMVASPAAPDALPVAPPQPPEGAGEQPVSAPAAAPGNEAALASEPAAPSPQPREVDEWTGTVFFAPDSSALHDSQLPILRRIAEDSQSRPDFRLRIISFADPRGDREFNTWLSQRRGDRVRNELSRLGVPLQVEVAVDFESDHSPVLENAEIQRRVELRYIR